MGRSTVAALIARGQAENRYNNVGIQSQSNAKWIDWFNAALQDLVEDINLMSALSINFVQGTREYDLPADFFEIRELWDAFGCPTTKRRYYDQIYGSYYNTPQGYYIRFNGDKYKIDLYEYNSDQVFNGVYIRYPALLTVADQATQTPEIPTIGENALIYYAISKAMDANNQRGQAQSYMAMYENERKKIRDAAGRALMGGF